MRVTHLSSACVLIEHKNTKVLTDPWLSDSEYYGSWAHYPPLGDIDFSQFSDLDYIYISHIHPDHMSRKSLAEFNNDIPILIHSYDSKFLKMGLQRLDKKVIELNHGELFKCGEGLNMAIYAADNCNPECCFKFHGCGIMEKKMGSTSIDSLAVFDNGDKTILNINDCPFELSEKTLEVVLNDFKKIDLLLVGYTGAGSYPQCWQNYSNEDKLKVYGKRKKDKFLNMGLNYIHKVNPKFYMPFAGSYTLSGKRANLEEFKVVPTLQEALSFYEKNIKNNSKGILLNHSQNFDLNSETQSKKYEPYDPEEKKKYIQEVLSKRKYDYEYDNQVSLGDISTLLEKSYERFNNKRKELNFSSKTNVYIYLPEEKMIKISCCGEGYDIIDEKDLNDENYVSYKLDFKLLNRILKGPRYAHWNNAEIGSHILFSRKPDVYQRALHFCMNYFHS
tara:strand:- start:7989 stop:9329 length:1341 start_codon:yes stop_codon:yes gene_type:complete